MTEKIKNQFPKDMAKKTIGQLSEFLGVSAHTIKYYEKQGLISSTRDEKSNYRHYSIRVCTEIYECVKYRNMGFSVKDSQFLLKEADTNEIDDMIKERIEDIDKQIEELLNIKKNINYYYKEIEELNSRLNNWYIEYIDPIYIYEQSEEFGYKTENSINHSSIDFTKYFPKTKSVMHVPKQSLEGGEFKFAWGLSLRESQIPKEVDKSCLKRVELERCFVTYHKYYVPYTVKFDSILENLRKTFEQYNFEFRGDAYFFRIKNAHEGNEGVEYFKVCIPI